MGDRSAEMLNILISIIVIIALMMLGFAIFKISERMMINSNNEIVEQIEVESGILEEVVLVDSEGNILQKSAKPEFHFDMRTFSFVAKTRIYSIVLFGLALLCLSLLLVRLKYLKKDTMDSYASISDYYKDCSSSSKRCAVVDDYIKGDSVVLFSDTPAISLFDYLFRIKDTAIKSIAIAIKNGTVYTVSGTVENAGMYYKIENYYLPKSSLYLKINTTTELTLYADDRETLKVNNNYILKKFKVVD